MYIYIYIYIYTYYIAQTIDCQQPLLRSRKIKPRYAKKEARIRRHLAYCPVRDSYWIKVDAAVWHHSRDC